MNTIRKRYKLIATPNNKSINEDYKNFNFLSNLLFRLPTSFT